MYYYFLKNRYIAIAITSQVNVILLHFDLRGNSNSNYTGF